MELSRSMYHILLNSDLEVIQKDLAPFIVNNFYCNHLSGNYMENNLLYIITMMLKDEINKLDNINQVDKFLENSKCGFLLEQLQKMPDIQIFFKKLIQKTVETIERTSSFREIIFNIADLQNELIELKKEGEFNIMEIDRSINYSKEENDKKVKIINDMFVQKYIPDITINDIKGLYEKAKEQEKNELFKYYKKLEKDINSKSDIYSNKMIMKNIFETNLSTHILTFYQNDFLKVISYIEQLLNDLKNNILLPPNSIILNNKKITTKYIIFADNPILVY